MRLSLERADGGEGTLTVRLIALNDTYEPVRLDRRLLVGPNPVASDLRPVSVEPRAENEAENLVLLNPWCLYGRERQFSLPQGTATFHGYLLARSEERLLPHGPADPTALAGAAEPLVVEC